MVYIKEMREFMTKKRRMIPLALMIVVALFILLGTRVQLYKDYQNSVERILISDLSLNHENVKFEGPLRENSIVFDEHLFFSLEEPYHVFYEGKDGVDYKYGKEKKWISILKVGVPVDQQFVRQLSKNSTLSEETISHVLNKYKFSHDIDAYLYAMAQFNEKKLSFFSSKEELQQAIVLNSAVEQFMQSFFLGEEKDPKITIIYGNVDGLELIDDMFQITNGQHAYNITFVGSYTEEEIEQFMKTVHIQ